MQHQEGFFRKAAVVGIFGMVTYLMPRPFTQPLSGLPLVSSFLLQQSYPKLKCTSKRFDLRRDGDIGEGDEANKTKNDSKVKRYNLGIGKHRPVSGSSNSPRISPKETNRKGQGRTFSVNKEVETSETLANALWDKEHYDRDTDDSILDCGTDDCVEEQNSPISFATIHDDELLVSRDELLIEGETSVDMDLSEVVATAAAASTGDDIDTSSSSYSGDKVWDVMRMEARKEAEREPLLVSFLFSSILNHDSLESALAFHLANRLASPSMISTQIMSLCLEAFNNSPELRDSLRADIMAVRERDPACTCLPDVFLYFKGFHAIQT